jgi:hypothetical protein
MRSDARSREGQDGCARLDPVLTRKGPKQAATNEDKNKHDGDAVTAAWLDAAIKMHGKATAYAEEIHVDLAHVSRMRTGEKSASLRHILPFMGNVEAVLAFVGPLLESVGYIARPVNGMTRAQLAEAVLSNLERERMGRKLIEQAGAEHGQTEEQVAVALRNEVSK